MAKRYVWMAVVMVCVAALGMAWWVYGIIHAEPGEREEKTGLALFANQDYAGAEAEYRKASEVGSTRSSTQLNLGWALLAGKKPKEALKMFEALGRERGKTVECVTGQGVALAAISREKDAKVAFEWVLAKGPGDTVVRYYYARVLMFPSVRWTHAPYPSTDDAMKAIEVLMPVIESKNTQVVLLMAHALNETENRASAKKLLEAALKDAPGDEKLKRAVREGPSWLVEKSEIEVLPVLQIHYE